MKLLLIILAFCPVLALADLERSLGRSPDDQYELILTASSEKDYGRVIVRDVKSGESTETESGQGYSYFPVDDIKATWKGSSDAFAVTLRGTKRTRNTDVYFRDASAWEKLEFPPFVANILGRQGVFKGGRNLYEEFASFEADDKFVLFCHIEADWQQQDETAKITTWKPTKQTEWKVVLEFHHRMSPNCTIVSITPLEDNPANQTVEPTR